MPTYEYRCEACSHNFDEFQSMIEKPLKKCPRCNKPKLRRVFGAGAAILFKGPGFYQTDYRSESYKAAAKADQESSRSATAGKDATTGTDGNGTTTSRATAGKTKGKSSKSSSKASDD